MVPSALKTALKALAVAVEAAWGLFSPLAVAAVVWGLVEEVVASVA